MLLNRWEVRKLVDSKLMLISLIEKFRKSLYDSQEYVVGNKTINKLNTMIINYNSGNISLVVDELNNFTQDELSMFSSPEVLRIVQALKIALVSKKGWRSETILGLIKKLHQDITENKLSEVQKKEESLNELSKIVDESLYISKYDLILEFILMCVDGKMLSATDAINLNFFVLSECNKHLVSVENVNDSEVVVLKENDDAPELVREKLCEVFAKYGYVYDEKRMGELDSKFVRYADVLYVDYILSMFNKYGITSNDIYIRKRALCNIVIDNDRETFNSVLKFVELNECSLNALLGIPAIFAKRKRNYVERDGNGPGTGGNLFEVAGANKDFFDNIELYKKLAKVAVIRDADLDRLGRFLCTPSMIVNKNLALLQKYNIVEVGSLPKSILALCGNDTEYIIDRFIEVGLYESYLLPRYNRNNEIKQPRGTYFLDIDGNPFRFYKMKRARDLGHDILASNGGIRKVFKDNAESYMGISLEEQDNSFRKIVQRPLSLDVINSISPEHRKSLSYPVQSRIDSGRISNEMIETLYFNNLFNYRVYSPVDIFEAFDATSTSELKGERISIIFEKDYKSVISLEEMKIIERDPFIKMLDEAIYCDSKGESKNVKTTELWYDFSHPSFPNVNVTISRYKVLRLCKLLKENGCWINYGSSKQVKENSLLSLIVKDTILSDTEMIVLRLAVREILTHGFIKVPNIYEDNKLKRGVRQ